MELFISFINLGIAMFKVLFAVPILGVLILLGIFGPMAVRAIKRR